MRVIANGEVPRCVAYSPDGSQLAAGGAGGVRVYSLPAGERIIDGYDLDGRAAEALAFSPGGAFVAGALGAELIVNRPDRSRIASAPGHADGTRAVAWAPDGSEVATSGWDRALRWWAPTLLPLNSISPTPEVVVCLAYHAGGGLLAGGGARRSLMFWRRAPSGMWYARAPTDVGQPTWAVAASRDGRTLAAGHADGRITLWDFAARQQTGVLSGHERILYGLAFTPDGTRLVSGGADGTVRLWDVPHRRPIETYRFHKSWVTCVAVSPDGMTAAVGGNDESLVLWDLADV